MDIATMVSLPGYAKDTTSSIPVVSSAGTGGQQATVTYKIPPAIWPFVFLIVGYVGIRLILDD